MSRPMPIVSVIVPIWQGEKTLLNCVHSILKQTYTALDVILVDDGSTDRTLALARSIASRDERVTVLTQPNSGVSTARNHGLDAARGQYAFFADSDDWVYPRAIETLVSFFEQGCQLAVGAFDAVIGTKTTTRTQYETAGQLSVIDYASELCKHANCMYYSALWNKLYDLDVIREHSLSFNQDLCWGEDFSFNMQYLRYIARVGVTEKPVYRYIRSLGGQAIMALFSARDNRASNLKTKLIMQQELQRTMAVHGLEKKYALIIASFYVSVTLLD